MLVVALVVTAKESSSIKSQGHVAEQFETSTLAYGKQIYRNIMPVVSKATYFVQYTSIPIWQA